MMRRSNLAVRTAAPTVRTATLPVVGGCGSLRESVQGNAHQGNYRRHRSRQLVVASAQRVERASG